MYLLDTNIISELRLIAKGRANPKLTQWARTCHSDDFFTSVVVLMELQKGILNKQRKDPKQAKVLKNWYDTIILPMFEGRILSIDNHTANICACLHIPNPAPENDAWIASTAIQHNLTLVTRNTKDFDIPQLSLLNPFE